MAPVRGRGVQLRLWFAFFLGCALGGAITGSLLGVLCGLLSPIPVAWRAALLGALVLALAVTDLRQPLLRLPQRTTLIPQEVFARGLARGGFRFGVEYGCGLRTLLPSAAPYLAALLVLLLAPAFGTALLLGAVFGASRSLAVLQRVLLGRAGWQQFLAAHTRTLERAGTLVTAALVAWAALLLLP
ncbi:hypothetical protein [Ornithinimicrobium avium]|uniref:Urease accessory protein UreH-like transmembrane domain-containing protein n=1 Tax=Ornithinimicrobium avium TaxID=2283195 RepID=A0A345NQ70_9MICO|nr:hypothetical protein [Ornithinimicrobium avium]AXH97178.1 hypothetical protein DV701_14585 [Ornithinimicrobium avium]